MPIVHLFFRKKRQYVNFSMENSFEQMIRAFPKESLFQVETYNSSYFSKGLVNRFLLILEARKHHSEGKMVSKKTHLMEIYVEMQKHFQTLNSDLLSTTKENGRICPWALWFVWLTVIPKVKVYHSSFQSKSDCSPLIITVCYKRAWYVRSQEPTVFYNSCGSYYNAECFGCCISPRSVTRRFYSEFSTSYCLFNIQQFIYVVSLHMRYILYGRIIASITVYERQI